MGKQITINFGDVEDKDFTPMPDGSYPVTVDNAKMKYGKDSGDPYVQWELIVTDGEFAGRHLWYNTSLSEKALWRTKEQFLNLGVITDPDEELTFDVDEGSEFVTSPELAGMNCMASVIQEVYKQKLKNTVEDLFANEGGAPMKASVKTKAPALNKAPAKTPSKVSATAKKPTVSVGKSKPMGKPGLKLK